MNGNRNKYTSAPLYGIRNRRRAAPADALTSIPQKPKQKNGRILLQMAMSFGLPIVFLFSLFFENVYIHWFFVATAVLCLLIMWITIAFVKNARTTLTLIYSALIVVSLVAIWISTPLSDTSNNGNVQNNAVILLKDSGTSVLDLNATQQQQSAIPTAEPTASPNTVSAAQIQLEQFMNSWMEVNYEGMLRICLPSWVSEQENAEKAIFQIRANRTPLDYEIENASGSEADTSRTFTMVVSIDKNNGKDPVLYRMQVLTLSINNVWYVDPRSLSSSEVVEMATADMGAQVTIQPTAVPSSTLLLYYNKDGGQYYHIDPNCPSINRKYVPLTASFLYRDVNSTTYKNLLPCSSCHAPAR